MGIFEKFKSGFKKSASAFTTGLRDIVVKKEIDDETLDKIEEYLIKSDKVLLSPHVAGWTHESHEKLALTIIRKIKNLRLTN